ncbi:MAG: class I SAM-dependent methyltransferase [Alcanivorax sp.]|nr:class I SAM-dependent methyltransferase [Alcanivorax sp.]
MALLPDAPADLPGERTVSEAAAAAAGIALVMGYRDGMLSLWRPEGREKPLAVDFGAGRMGYRLAAERARHERLVRAVGKQKGLLVDATAGLGRDAALLARAGWQLILLERQPLLHAMLADALRRDAEMGQRMQPLRVDSLTWLQQRLHSDLPRPEVICLDPMFPERDKSAAIKKDLAWLQQLCGGTSEGEEIALLAAARALAGKRVVVKRPLRAPPLGGVAPSHALPGKTVRFDVYLTSF